MGQGNAKAMKSRWALCFIAQTVTGGFKVSKERLAAMPTALVNPSGWYEEDCEFSKVVLAFPECFEHDEWHIAAQDFKYWL